MNREDLRAAAAGYALGALEEPEKRQFETLLALADSGARQALAEWDSTMTALAYAETAIPPRSLKRRLMRRVLHLPVAGRDS